jgi:predicted HTH domain antitoxin
MLTITVDIPDDLAANFDTPEAIRQALFEDFVIEQRQRGAISLGKAAELLGIRYPEVFDLLSSKGLSPINASPQDLDESYLRLVELMDKGSRAGLGAARRSAAD